MKLLIADVRGRDKTRFGVLTRMPRSVSGAPETGSKGIESVSLSGFTDDLTGLWTLQWGDIPV